MATYSFSAQMIHLRQNNNQSRVVVWTFATANWNNMLRCFLGCTTTIWTRITKCKSCEMFPPLDVAGPNKFKFGKQAVKLTDHPTRDLKVHRQSKKYISATKQYEGTVLTLYFAILPANRNQTVDLHSKSTVWFLPAGSNAK